MTDTAIRTTTEELFHYTGAAHWMTFGPTGSSKTNGPVICNALTHPG